MFILMNVVLNSRRFGKSTNLSMLKSFLSLGASADKFAGFKISEEKEIVEKHCGQYPVVHLDFKECKGSNWEEMRTHIWSVVKAMVLVHKVALKDDLADSSDPIAVMLSKPNAPTENKAQLHESLL